MAATSPASDTDALLRSLWDDRSLGRSLKDLPDSMRSEALLIACASQELIELGELRFAGGQSDAEIWHRHDFGDQRPLGPFLQAAFAGRVPVFDKAVTSPGRVRLTKRGEAVVAGWTVKP